MQAPAEAKKLLLAMLEAALAAVHGTHVVSRWLRRHPAQHFSKVIAIGKAAPAMAAGAVEVLDAAPPGLVVTKAGYLYEQLPDSLRLFEAGHPVPDAASLEAGRRLLELLSHCDAHDHLLFLISGGASALVEVLPPSVSPARLADLNRWLIGAGYPIDKINQVRRACSQIKGGGLLNFIPGCRVSALYISDVIGDDPCTIGSGLLCAQPQPPEAALWSALEKDGAPAWITALGRRGGAGARSTCRPAHHLVASLDHALQAAAACARGYTLAGRKLDLLIADEYLAADYDAAAEKIVATLAAHGAGIYLWGGEVTVRLPPAPGVGGRNQQLALAVAVKLAQRGLSERVSFMAVGTDGTDGNTGDAGALIDAGIVDGGTVDGGTLARGSLDGLDALDCLRRADAGSFLRASGDLIHTGPTGTNVMDLYIACRWD